MQVSKMAELTLRLQLGAELVQRQCRAGAVVALGAQELFRRPRRSSIDRRQRL